MVVVEIGGKLNGTIHKKSMENLVPPPQFGFLIGLSLVMTLSVKCNNGKPRLSWFDSYPHNLSAEHYIMDNEIQRWKT